MTVGYRQQAVLPKDPLLYQTDGVMGSFLLIGPRGQCSLPSVTILNAKDPPGTCSPQVHKADLRMSHRSREAS